MHVYAVITFPTTIPIQEAKHMTPIDDVAEKIGDVLLNESVKAGAAISDTMPLIANSLASATKHTIDRLRTQIREDRDMRRLLGLEGEVSEAEMNEAIRKLGQRSSTVSVSDADAKEFAQLLEERKVLFARLDKTDDNCKLFVFLNRDIEKVHDAVQLMQARRGLVTELNPQLFFNSLHPEKVKEIEGIDRVELEIFRHFARKEGLVFTAMLNRDGKFSIYHETDDKSQSKANLIMTQMSWMLSGPMREQIRQQIENRIAGRNTLEASLDDPQKELFVVSKTDPTSFIHITENDFTQYKKGEKISSLPRSREDFPEKCMAYCDGLERPVVLAPDDFRSDLTVTDMSKYPTMDFLSHGYDEIRETEKLNELISLVCMKAGIDNENNAGITLWDSSVSFSAFAENEAYADDTARDRAEADYERLQEAAEYPKKRFIISELTMDDKDINYIIARAEEKQRAQTAPFGKDRTDRQDMSI